MTWRMEEAQKPHSRSSDSASDPLRRFQSLAGQLTPGTWFFSPKGDRLDFVLREVVHPGENIGPSVAQMLAHTMAPGTLALVAPFVERFLGDVESPRYFIDRYDILAEVNDEWSLHLMVREISLLCSH